MLQKSNVFHCENCAIIPPSGLLGNKKQAILAFLTFPLPHHHHSINKTQVMFYNVCSLSHVLLRVLRATVIILYSGKFVTKEVWRILAFWCLFSDARIRNIPSVRIYIRHINNIFSVFLTLWITYLPFKKY